MPKLSEEMAKTEFEFEEILGQGSFGLVSLFKCKEKLDSKTHYLVMKTSEDKSLFKEFKILSEFKGCSRIIQCYGNSVGKRINDTGFVEYKILMEYARGGNLKNFMMKRFKDKRLPEPLIKKFTRMLLEGLATIHEQGYVHCDIKPENILVFPSRVYENGQWIWTYELKISDFGLTKREGDNKWWSPRRRFAGTSSYMSPESVSRGETRRGLDLWSLGCVVLEMYTGKKPWWHKEDYLMDLMNCCEPLIPDYLPADAKCFLMTCFAGKPDERKDAVTLLEYSFVCEYVDESHETREPWIDVKKQNRLEVIIRQNLWKLGFV